MRFAWLSLSIDVDRLVGVAMADLQAASLLARTVVDRSLKKKRTPSPARAV
jgi:hypothetical protein